MDQVRFPSINAARPLGAAAFSLGNRISPASHAPKGQDRLSLPSFETLIPQRYRPDENAPRRQNAADQFLARYGNFDNEFSSGFGMGMGGVGAPFTNVGAIAGGALADAAGDINAAAQRNGIPANLLAAIIARESTGNWARDGSRYVYLSDRGHNILPYTGMTDPAMRRVGMDPRSVIGDRAGQIEAAARLVRQIADNEASGYGWQGVANVYYSGDPSGRTTPGDSYQYGTTQEYGNDILNFWNILEPGGPSAPMSSGGGGGAASSMGSFGGGGISTIFGGNDFPLTQDFGLTDFARGAGAYMYGYSTGLGVQGHAGLDYGMVPGTPLHAPVGGTVIVAGGSGYYTDERYGNRGGTGELRIKLDNGDEVILGHMERINVQVGQRVNPGQNVGTSGTSNGGHLHLEVRRHTPGATSTGYTAVDPRNYFSSMTGGMSGGFAQSGMQAFPGDFSRGLGTNLGSLFGW